ncbi:coiled-coil domain-containing protein 200 isoform X2 [Pyxicephalus adspersus]|uniref:coiled-coil domain-containing protein 200 isoform X2 n=1 Tax=Pyxicephalus adspersus TaxID=30357 RepID=UPI003B5A38B9
MSAYHWEARRKQHVLDQRRANLENMKSNTVQPPAHSSKQIKNTKEKKTVSDKHCKHCNQGTYNPISNSDDDYSAKTKNRYNVSGTA